jgi:pimeloyl-ACP methyl ester carboxylesterase
MMQNPPGRPPAHFLVLVPGYMGSKLRDPHTGKLVWVDFQSIPLNPFQWQGWLDNLFEKMAYPNPLEPAGIMDEVLFLPPWAKQEHYGRLLAALRKMGYRDYPDLTENERNLYTFSYDWRQDNRLSARQLSEAVQRWSGMHPSAQAWLIAHSNGGIVSRWYIEKEGGDQKVGRLFLMGSPWDGAPKAMQILYTGLDSLFRRGFNLFNIQQRTRAVLRTFPSAYQLLPARNPFLRDLNNEVIDVYEGGGWLNSSQHQQYLTDARLFNEMLGNDLSVETLSFFGRKRPTLTMGALDLAAGGAWGDIRWMSFSAGDGTVPERSAVYSKAAANLPFAVGHGDIYANPAVLEFLEWELFAKYQGLTRSTALTERLRITFEPEKDTFSPGEPVSIWAAVNELDGITPVYDAVIRARMVYRQPLPGMAASQVPEPLQPVELHLVDDRPGRYEGTLEAPQMDGYYELQAEVKVENETVSLSELAAVETPPTGIGV